MRTLILSSALAHLAFRSGGLADGHAQTQEELLRRIQREGANHPIRFCANGKRKVLSIDTVLAESPAMSDEDAFVPASVSFTPKGQLLGVDAGLTEVRLAGMDRCTIFP